VMELRTHVSSLMVSAMNTAPQEQS
jgi:hypothetical protein